MPALCVCWGGGGGEGGGVGVSVGGHMCVLGGRDVGDAFNA